MGVEMKTVSLKLSEQTMKQVDELRDAFWPFTENRSQVFRVLVEIVHSLVFTKGTLKAIVERLQGMLRNTSYFQLEFEFPPSSAAEADAGLSGLGPRRPRVVSISRRGRVDLAALGMEALSTTSFLRETFAVGRIA